MSNSYNDTEKNNTDDTIVYIPRKIINKLTIENGVKEKVMNEKLNILQDALKKKNNELSKLKENKNIDSGEIQMKEKKRLLTQNEEYDIGNMLENNNMSEHSQLSVSSIFKKKGENDKSENKVLSQQGGNKSDKNIKSHKSDKKVLSQQGGNKSDKNIKSHKSEEKNKKHAKIKSESESEDEEENETSDEESESGSSQYTDSNSSTSYEDTSDIYRATETDDGINKVYSKINREMDFIEKKQNGGKMTGKEVVKRINFLLNGLRILDNVKKINKKKK